MNETDVEEKSSHPGKSNNIFINRTHLHPSVLFSSVSADSQGGISVFDPQYLSFPSSELVPTHHPSTLGQTKDETSVVAREPSVTRPFIQDGIIKPPTTSGISHPTRDKMIRAGITDKWNGSDTMLENDAYSLEAHDISLVGACVALPSWEKEEKCASGGQVVVALWSASNDDDYDDEEEEDEEDLYTHPSFHSTQQTKWVISISMLFNSSTSLFPLKYNNIIIIWEW